VEGLGEDSRAGQGGAFASSLAGRADARRVAEEDPQLPFPAAAFFSLDYVDAARIDGSSELGIFWRVILPSARAGIFGATILALGRALGETIAVTMVIGNAYAIPQSIFQPAYTLASVIANEFTEATGTIYPAALIELGVVLILVTLVVNVIALLLVRSTAGEARLTA